MQPEVVELLLDDDFVPRAAVDADLHQQGGVLHGLGAVAADEVGGAAHQVVRVARAAHLIIQLVARVAAGLPAIGTRVADSLSVPVQARCRCRDGSAMSPSP